jgi:hypothetical protein
MGNPITAQIILDMPISTRFIFGEPVSARFISGDPVSARIIVYIPVTLATAPRAVSQRHRRSAPYFQAAAGRYCLVPNLKALKNRAFMLLRGDTAVRPNLSDDGLA